MEYVPALRTVQSCVVMFQAWLRVVLGEHWHVTIDEMVMAFAVFLMIASVMRKKMRTGQATIAGAPAPLPARQPDVLKKVYLVAVLLFFGYQGGKLCYSVLQMMELARAEESWPATEAMILGSTLRSTWSKNSGERWSPVWTYTYAVGNRTYRSESMALAGGFDATWYPDREDAVASGQARTQRGTAAVYYDPADPSRSVLDRRPVGGGEALGMAVALLTMLFPIGMIAVVVRTKKREHDKLQTSQRIEPH